MDSCAECGTLCKTKRELYAHMVEEHGSALLLVDLDGYPKAVVNLNIPPDKIKAMRTMAMVAANSMGLQADHIAYPMEESEIQIVYCGDTIKLKAQVWEHISILPPTRALRVEENARPVVYASKDGFTVHFHNMPEGVRVTDIYYSDYLAVVE